MKSEKLSPSARAQLVYVALLAVTLAWLGLICAAPGLAAGGHYSLAALVYGGLAAVCHQMPARSFHMLGYPLGVCARCLGIYAGFLLGLLLYPFLRRMDDETTPARRWLLLAAMPAAVDFAGGAAGLLTNTSSSRAVTGLIIGAAVAFYILPGLLTIKFRAVSLQPQPGTLDSRLEPRNPLEDDPVWRKLIGNSRRSSAE